MKYENHTDEENQTQREHVARAVDRARARERESEREININAKVHSSFCTFESSSSLLDGFDCYI